MMDMISFLSGVAMMAVVTFLMNWFVYSELKSQRDFWKNQFCYEVDNRFNFCG